MSNSKEKTLSDSSLADQLLYIRAFTYGSDDGGIFSLCAYEPVCRPDTVDAGEVKLCQGETYQLGTQTLTEDGDFTEIFQNSSGCDSVVTLTVGVTEVNIAVIQNGETLTAQAAGATYQWISCSDGNKVLVGQTAPIFTAPSEGEYALIVTENSCVDTSACYSIQIVGLANEEKPAFKVFPNPAAEILNIELLRPYENAWIELLDMEGRIIKTERFRGNALEILNIKTIPSGTYFLRIYKKDGSAVMKIMKE